VNLDLILTLKPALLTIARALRYTMTSRKSLIQEILDDLNPFY
jgi:hypothetical protein